MLIQFSYDNNCEVKIARCFAFVGPYLPLNTHFAIGNFILAGLKKMPISIKGDGTAYRSYLYAADLIRWLWTILLCGKNRRPYNVGSSQAITIAQLADWVASVFKPKLIVERKQLPDGSKPADRYIPSVERADRELGLRQQVSLIDAIKKTKMWHEQCRGKAE